MIHQFRKHLSHNYPLILLYFVVSTVIVFLLQKYRLNIQLFLINSTQQKQLLDSLSNTFYDFMTLTFGIIVEAFPFVVLGVTFAAIIQNVLPIKKILAKLPKTRILRRAVISCMGVLMPVCECGNIPVARSLIVRGFSTQEAIVFLLAAPSVNVVTFIVTWEAFSFNHSVAIVRVIATIIIANITAMIVTSLLYDKNILSKQFVATCKAHRESGRSLRAMAQTFREELWLVSRLLVIGAMIAAASQVFVPREAITAIGSNVFLSVIAMLVLAFVISICSSVDAFFALAYVNTFSLGSIMAFLVAGPMVDIKMIAMLKSTFTFRALSIITTRVLLLSFILGVILSYVW